jgi:hypothetical protein
MPARRLRSVCPWVRGIVVPLEFEQTGVPRVLWTVVKLRLQARGGTAMPTEFSAGRVGKIYKFIDAHRDPVQCKADVSGSRGEARRLLRMVQEASI